MQNTWYLTLLSSWVLSAVRVLNQAVLGLVSGLHLYFYFHFLSNNIVSWARIEIFSSISYQRFSALCSELYLLMLSLRSLVQSPVCWPREQLSHNMRQQQYVLQCSLETEREYLKSQERELVLISSPLLRRCDSWVSHGNGWAAFCRKSWNRKHLCPAVNLGFCWNSHQTWVAQKNGTRPLRSTKSVYEKIPGISHCGDGFLCNSSPQPWQVCCCWVPKAFPAGQGSHWTIASLGTIPQEEQTSQAWPGLNDFDQCGPSSKYFKHVLL